MFRAVFLITCLPTIAYALICHRCFGNSFCHDPSHLEFGEGIRNATCSSTSYWSESLDDGSFESQVQKALNENFRQNFLNGSTREVQLQQHCLTATVQEPHDSYTLRTCLSRNVPTSGSYLTLCEFIEQHIAHQNFYSGNFSCRQCNDGDFCNVHTLTGDGSLSPSSPEAASSSLTYVGSIGLVASIALLLINLVW